MLSKTLTSNFNSDFNSDFNSGSGQPDQGGTVIPFRKTEEKIPSGGAKGASLFQPAIFRKTVLRFWPLWLTYLALLFVAMPMSANSILRHGATDSAMLNLRGGILNNAGMIGVVMGFIAAILSVMAVWSFLYNARSMSGTASLPVRRESVFLSVCAAGILPLLCVNVLIVLLTLLVEALRGAADLMTLLQWFSIVTLELLFFYGFATFCAQLTGHILALPAVFGVLNVTVAVVWSVVNSLCQAFVYGISGNIRLYNTAMLFSPPITLMERISVEPVSVWNSALQNYVVADYRFEGWRFLVCYAIAGLVFTLCALLLYRVRRMETAGDVVAIEVLKPIFKYCMTFGSALVLSALLVGMFGVPDAGIRGLMLTLLYMFIGAFAGWTISKMLIHKSFRVWRKDWLGLGICCAVLAAAALCVEFDVTGFEKRVPGADTVKSVAVSCNGDTYTLREAENVDSALALHRLLVEKKSRYDSPSSGGTTYFDNRVTTEAIAKYSGLEVYSGLDTLSVTFMYDLEDGGTMFRRYGLWYVEGAEDTLEDILKLQTLSNTHEAIQSRKATPYPFTVDNIYYGDVNVTLFPEDSPSRSGYSPDGSAADSQASAYPQNDVYSYSYTFTPNEIYELYENCILPDIEDGTLGRVWYITDDEYLDTVYDAVINIEARQPRTDWSDFSDIYPSKVAMNGDYDPMYYAYAYFSTTPTKDAVRTTRWLEEHGVIMHTEGEVREWSRSDSTAAAPVSPSDISPAYSEAVEPIPAPLPTPEN